MRREPVDLLQEVRHGDGEAEIDERLGDLAVPDAKCSVARHPRHYAFAWMHHTEIVKARDVEAVADELRKFLDRRRLSRCHPERVRQGTPVARFGRRRMARRLRAVASLRGGCAVPDHCARHPVLDELHVLLRRPLEVERLREPARVERIVRDRDLVVEHLLSEPAREVAALFEQAEGAERVVGEVLQQLGQRVGLEHDAVDTGLDLLGAFRSLCLRRRLPRDGRRVDAPRAPCGLLRVARPGVVGCDHESRGVGHRLADREAGGGGNREL